MTSAAPVAAASAKNEQASEFQQQQGAALCDVAVTTAAAAAASSCTMDATVRDAVLDWAKSMSTTALFFPEDDSTSGASSSTTSNASDVDGSSPATNKKRKCHPGETSSSSFSSPRTTMITPPLMVFPPKDQSGAVNNLASNEAIAAAAAAASAAATAAYLSMALQASSTASEPPSASPTSNHPPAKKMKRWGGVVQRTHSPKSNKSITNRLGSADTSFSNVQLVTPTVDGIQQVARHLLNNLGANTLTVPSLAASIPMVTASHHRHRFVALPTECSYEVTTLIDWNKKQPLLPADHSLRKDRLRHLQSAASASSKSRKMSSSSLHICLPHDNIRLIDRLFDFPKRAYAVKQNPLGGCYTLNETRIVFQRLADHFWPGPVMIYLAVPPNENGDTTKSFQQHVPKALLHEAPVVGDADKKKPPIGESKVDHEIQKKYVGFRCPSHPLSVKVLRHVHQATRCISSSASAVKGGASSSSSKSNRKVLIAAPVATSSPAGAGAPVVPSSSHNHHKKKCHQKKTCHLALQAKDVALQMATQFPKKQSGATPTSMPRVQILHGEEKREMFTVPTCQFQDEWLECWIVQSTRTLIIRGKSRRQIPSLSTLLRIKDSSAPSAMTSPPASPRSSHNSRVVRSVLGQWKLVDQRIIDALSSETAA